MLEMDAVKQKRSCRYSIDWKSDLDSYFDIDPVEGTISTNELLDRESIARHNISIVATKLSKHDDEIHRGRRSRRCASAAIIGVKDLTHFCSSQYSIPFCRKASAMTINCVFETVSPLACPPPPSTLFSFVLSLFLLFIDIGIEKEQVVPESTFTYNAVKSEPSGALQRAGEEGTDARPRILRRVIKLIMFL